MAPPSGGWAYFGASALRHEFGLDLNGFSKGEYQSPQRSHPDNSSPSKISPIVSALTRILVPMAGLYRISRFCATLIGP